MSDEAAFQAELDAHPANHAARAIFADWLDEQGDPRGEALCWLAQRGCYPHHVLVRGGEEPGDRITHWYWACQDGSRRAPHDVPKALWVTGRADRWLGARWSIPHPSVTRITEAHSSRRAAEDTFARAYHLAKEQGWQPDYQAAPHWTAVAQAASL